MFNRTSRSFVAFNTYEVIFIQFFDCVLLEFLVAIRLCFEFSWLFEFS